MRKLPLFIIVGGCKCGTTDMNNIFWQHPNLVNNRSTHELHFFDMPGRFAAGVERYKEMWPELEEDQFPYEHSPGTLERNQVKQDGAVTKRINAWLPDTKFIICLRNPVDRAYSHYNMIKRSNRDSRPFLDAFEGVGRFSIFYKKWGLYADILEKWFEDIPRDRCLITISEHTWEHHQKSYDEICDFLGIKRHIFENKRYGKRRDYKPMTKKDRKHLSNFFRKHNHRLLKILGDCDAASRATEYWDSF